MTVTDYTEANQEMSGLADRVTPTPDRAGKVLSRCSANCPGRRSVLVFVQEQISTTRSEPYSIKSTRSPSAASPANAAFVEAAPQRCGSDAASEPASDHRVLLLPLSQLRSAIAGRRLLQTPRGGNGQLRARCCGSVTGIL